MSRLRARYELRLAPGADPAARAAALAREQTVEIPAGRGRRRARSARDRAGRERRGG
jgi:hypothetical protein